MVRLNDPPKISAGFYPQPEAGFLRISGQDRTAFLQRQSTNDVQRLAPGNSLVTVLTTPAARIQDVLRLIEEQDAIGAIPLPGQAVETASYLKGRIFFMDKVTVEDASADYFQADLEGGQAPALLTRLGFNQPPGMDEVSNGEIGGSSVRAIGQPGLAGLGFRLLAPAGSAGQVVSALMEAGAELLKFEQYEIYRVEAGLPRAKAELTGEYTPLEAGLEAAISDSKGCYTGQEVIARQLTYDKVTQRLAGLRLTSPVEVGGRIWAEGRPVGKVTSFAQSPGNGPIALGVIKRPYHEPGTRLEVGDGEARIPAVVATLPFQAQDGSDDLRG